MRSVFYLTLSAIATLAAAASNNANPFNIPKDGYTFKAGEPTTLTWDPTTSGTVTLRLQWGAVLTSKSGTAIAQSIDNSGSFTWTPPSDIVAQPDYTVEIISDDDTSDVNYLPRFTVAGAAPYSKTSSATSTATSTSSETSSATKSSSTETTTASTLSSSSSTESPTTLSTVTSSSPSTASGTSTATGGSGGSGSSASSTGTSTGTSTSEASSTADASSTSSTASASSTEVPNTNGAMSNQVSGFMMAIVFGAVALA